MNGRLHLGHAFSLTKAEFAAGFKRLQGYNVLFPFGFHCTGMPIQAAANKLRAEIDTYGNPPVFPAANEKSLSSPKDEALEKQMAALAKKGKAKKAKAASKSGGGAYQWTAMEKMGLEPGEIAAFADPNKWLRYFPPLGVADLELFGASIDWRRSFITTALNPYYDSFVRWQFKKLRAADKISFGKRANVYSVRDGQVCADHDRASGEGVGPQEYVLIKLQMVDSPLPGALSSLTGRKVYLVPATLRPETMYGQTNCYVLPDGEYGAYEQANGEIFVCSRRAALGLAYQGWFDAQGGYHPYAARVGKVVALVEPIKGYDLLGAALSAPLAKYDKVFTLPLTTISMSKGTGIVTSVPSDAPDDWIALRELKDQAELREKYSISSDMVEPYDVVPVIRITVGKGESSSNPEGWTSDVSAEYWCNRLEIKSQKDQAKLKEAKAETYLHGFNSGIMLVGDYIGKKVSEAKLLVKNDLVASGHACLYFEPESPVVSRSGDDCIVAHTEQWYLKYGEDEWRTAVEAHVDSSFEAYNAENLARFKYTLGWMKEWACSRLFGLGTNIPWDERWVIESLSDSTIYMAYYTVAHILHGINNLDGASTDMAASKRRVVIPTTAMTDAVWDYVFLGDDVPRPTHVDSEALDAMRREFRYWYPMDLRVSGKDLIGNHLTMCLYNHAAVWPTRPELWPRSMYCNGFVLLDGEKMAKSTGNFLMLDEACRLYSTDGVRFALADAGDTLEDANFERKRADAAVVMLFVEEEFARKVCARELELRDADSPCNFMDRAFDNELNALANQTTAHFNAMRWRDGAISGAFELQNARDVYRDWCYRTMVPMHAALARRYVKLAAILIAPICPHFAEHIWGRVLGEQKPNGGAVFGGKGPGTLRSKVWPDSLDVDLGLSRAFNFLRKASRSLRLELMKDAKNKPVTTAYIYVNSAYSDWKRAALAFMREQCAQSDGKLPDKKSLLASFKSHQGSPCVSDKFKKQQKHIMQFSAFMYDFAVEIGLEALDETLPFDQSKVLCDSLTYLQNSLNPAGKISKLSIFDLATTPDAPGPDRKKDNAYPGNPTIYGFNE